MSRIYYRGGMSPFETFSPGYILTHNVIGTNVGNFFIFKWGIAFIDDRRQYSNSGKLL